MGRRAGLVLALLIASPNAAVAAGFEAPPENLLYQLRKQNQSRPWLLVRTDSTRWTFRAHRLDEHGLAEFKPRHDGSIPDRPIGWASIERIDELRTREQSGRLLGFVAGGILGAALGNAVGTSVRSDPVGGEGDDSNGHGGFGTVVGIAIIGGAGAWIGSRWGDRLTRERPWYTGVPASPESTAAFDAAATDSALARSATASTSSEAVLRACDRIAPEDRIRVRGELGDFVGHAAIIGPQGLDGMRPEAGSAPAAVPVTFMPWDSVFTVEKWGNNAGRGAVVGAIIVAVPCAIMGSLLAAVVSDGEGDHGTMVGGAILGAALTAPVGALLGAAFGGSSKTWHRVYAR